jgi:hypothetical protein
MHPDLARQVGHKLRNLEANRFGLIGYATLTEIDCVHDHRLKLRRQVLGDRVSHDGRREAAQRADLHHPVRRENADESMKKQQVAPSDCPGGVALVRE